MKRFIIEQSDEVFYTSTSGISLVGLGLNRFTTLVSSLAKSVPLAHGIPHADVLKAFCALLAQGKSDFAAIEQHREDDFFREALGLTQVPSEPTMRQRMDEHGSGVSQDYHLGHHRVSDEDQNSAYPPGYWSCRRGY
jgi:hypothetical protein